MNRLKPFLQLSTIWFLALGLVVAGTYAGCGGGSTTNNNNNANTNQNNGNNNNNANTNQNNNTPKDKCKSDGDCPPGQSCKDNNGIKECMEDASQNEVDKIEIINGGGVIRQGQKRTLEAAALNKSGARITSSFTFKWTSSAADVVSIDEGTGELTGGSKSGSATITVTLEGKTATTDITNFGEVEQGKARVIVLNNKGEAVSGAKVKVGTGEGDTDATGAVVIDGQTPPFDVHIFHKDYSYFSAYGVNKTDLYIQLSKSQDTSKAGGVEGGFNFDTIQSLFGIKDEDWPKYNVELGISGLSLSDNILSLSFDLLLGESVPTTIPVVNREVDLPNGVVLGISGKGKTGLKILGEDGKRVMWGFGGKFQISELLPLIPSDTKNINIGEILGKAKPLLKKMAFGYDPAIEVKAGSFANKKLGLTQKLEQTVKVSASGVPTVKDKDGKDVQLLVIGLTGSNIPGLGLVPTGLMVEQATSSNVNLDVAYAKRNGVLTQGKFAVLTLALTLPIGDDPPPLRIFADIQLFDTPPTSVTVSKFTELATNAKFDPSTRKLEGGTSADGQLYHFTFSGKDGKGWTVVYPKGKDGFTLPAVPSGYSDPINGEGEASFRAVVLQSGITMDTILEFNGTNMDKLINVIKGFSNLGVYEPPKKP